MKVRSEQRLSGRLGGGAVGRNVKIQKPENSVGEIKAHTSGDDERQGEGKIITFDIVEATFCADSCSIKDLGGQPSEQAREKEKRRRSKMLIIFLLPIFVTSMETEIYNGISENI